MKYNTFQNDKELKIAEDFGYLIKPFNEILKDNSRYTDKISTDEYLEKGKYPVIDQGNNEIAGYTNILMQNNNQEIPAIVFGDHTRVVKYIDFPFYAGADGTKILNVISEDYDTKYIYYYLKYLEIPHNGYSRHFKFLKQIYLPIPPIKIQKRIVSILDLSSKLIEKRKKQLYYLNELTQSIFIEMFSNIFISNNRQKLINFITLNPSKKEVSEITNKKVSFIPMSSVGTDGKITDIETKFVEEVYKGYTFFKDNDVVVAKITPCFENGKGAVVNGLENGIGFGSTEFHVLRPNNEINSLWLYQLTKTNFFREKGALNMTGSAGQKRVPKSYIENILIEIPEIEKQNKYASIIEEIESQKSLMEKSLIEMENNFNALMQKAFNGELFPEE